MAEKEYIEREAAYPLAKKICDTFYDGKHSAIEMPHLILDLIDDLPAADVRPVVKARWKPVMCADNPNIQDRDEWYGLLFVCDKCNWTMIGESNFCPNCGAKMEESE
jgi:rubrerythrin